MKWSEEQLSAINSIGQNILVSAGAGSGKTAVLSERVYQLCKNNADITRFLILTFTEAAAAEMKNRIRKKLLDDENLSPAADAVESAHIETFDAFTLFICKKYSYQLGLSSNVSIIDSGLESIKKKEIVEELLLELYKSKDQTLINTLKKYSNKSDANISEFIIDIYEKANKTLNPNDFYLSLMDKYQNSDFINQQIDEYYRIAKNKIDNIYQLSFELQGKKDSENVVACIEPFTHSKNYDELYDTCINFSKFPNKTKEETDDGNLRDYIKNTLAKYIGEISDLGKKEDIINNYIDVKESALMLVDLAQKLDNRLMNFKKANNVFSFDDIAHFALSLLRNKDITLEMSQTFDFIMVDEYQDTSDIQEEVISNLARNNVYMVGDVKQAIYRFRNANCSIFLDKFNNYKKGVGGKEIDLNQSFRSRIEVVNAVNDVFSKLMDKKYNIIDYSNGHNFKYGQKEYLNHIDDNEDYKLKIYNYDLEKGQPKAEAEARLIVNDIIHKINSGYLVYDGHDFRPCEFKDFAILIDVSTHFDDYQKLFAEYNVPLAVYSDEEVHTSDIAYVIRSLIKLFVLTKENKYDHKEYTHAFMSIARSFVNRMDDQKLFNIVTNKLYRATDIDEKILSVLAEYDNSSIYNVLKELLDTFGVYNKISTIGLIEANNHKIELFLQMAKNFDELGYTIAQFDEHLSKLSKYDLEISYANKDKVDNSVSLMTIHKSKGLEFAFIYLPGFYNRFNRPDVKSKFVVNKKYGLCLPNQNNNFNLLEYLFKNDDNKEDFEERLRLLYVAFTRAKERIIIPLNNNNSGKTVYDLTEANSFDAILRFIGVDINYASSFQQDDEKLAVKPGQLLKKHFVLKSISIPYKEIQIKKASKDSDDEISQDLLDFGIKVHYALEVVDYEKKDTSFIKEYNIRKYVSNILHNHLFDNVKNDQIIHEYPFYDDINEINGIIDCLIKRDNQIDIIDFKLKSIDDAHYDEQLKVYARFIRQKTNYPIKLYLLSAITGETREVVFDE